jgi:Ca2+-binding EF-hand superfamily protein
LDDNNFKIQYDTNDIWFRYDFDRDGYITKEDVRLILSHIPIVNTVNNKTDAEGTFTKEGGGK